MTVAQLGAAVGVTKQTISAWELDRNTPPLAAAMRLELVLGGDVTVEQIVPKEDSETLGRWIAMRAAKQRAGAVP